MVIYWRFQLLIDTLVVIAFVALMMSGVLGWKVELDANRVIETARMWVAPVLTLLGMVCATTSFLFSVVERSEFKLIRDIGVERQLWSVFSELIFWLAVSAVSAATLSFVQPSNFTAPLKGFAYFLFGIVSLCLLKFAWVMRQIISVRASR